MWNRRGRRQRPINPKALLASLGDCIYHLKIAIGKIERVEKGQKDLSSLQKQEEQVAELTEEQQAELEALQDEQFEAQAGGNSFARWERLAQLEEKQRSRLNDQHRLRIESNLEGAQTNAQLDWLIAKETLNSLINLVRNDKNCKNLISAIGKACKTSGPVDQDHTSETIYLPASKELQHLLANLKGRQTRSSRCVASQSQNAAPPTPHQSVKRRSTLLF